MFKAYCTDPNPGRGRGVAISLLLVTVLAAPALAIPINMALRIPADPVLIGETVNVELWLVATNPPGEDWNLVELLLLWDPTFLDLQGFTDAQPLTSNFFGGSDPEGPGSALWGAQTGLNPLFAPTFPGMHVTTFQFEALAETSPDKTMVSLSNQTGQTYVVKLGGSGFEDVTGTLGQDNVEIQLPEPATATMLLVGLAGVMKLRKRRGFQRV